MSVDTRVFKDDSNTDEKQLTVDSVINWQLPVLAILFVSVVFIAIKTVVHRHESRTAYVKLQKLMFDHVDPITCQRTSTHFQESNARPVQSTSGSSVTAVAD